jgi:hypothetical protein
MHGYMMPSIAPKNNPQIIFTWLHYAATTGARMPAKSGNSRLYAISSQKLGGELPVRRAGLTCVGVPVVVGIEKDDARDLTATS